MWGIIFFPLKQIDLHSCASIIKINFNKVWLNKTCSQNVFKLQSITSESKWHFVDPTGCMQKKKNAKKDGHAACVKHYAHMKLFLMCTKLIHQKVSDEYAADFPTLN